MDELAQKLSALTDAVHKNTLAINRLSKKIALIMIDTDQDESGDDETCKTYLDGTPING